MSATERPTGEQLAAIRERCAAAMPGPWQAVDWDGWVVRQDAGDGHMVACASAVYPECCIGLDQADAQFIAAARADVPALLRWLEQAQQREGMMVEAIADVRHQLALPEPLDVREWKMELISGLTTALLAALPTEGD